MARILIKPAADKQPRSPLPPYERIPAEGVVREDASGWRRLERAGDVVITPEPEAAPARPARVKP